MARKPSAPPTSSPRKSSTAATTSSTTTAATSTKASAPTLTGDQWEGKSKIESRNKWFSPSASITSSSGANAPATPPQPATWITPPPSSSFTSTLSPPSKKATTSPISASLPPTLPSPLRQLVISNEAGRLFLPPTAPTVISNEAGRLFLPASLLRSGRPAQREISLLFALCALPVLCLKSFSTPFSCSPSKQNGAPTALKRRFF